MDLKEAVRRTQERMGLVHPVIFPPFVVFSSPIEHLLDSTSTPLSSREIRALSSYKGGIFRKIHPIALDGTPTVEDMVRRPSVFSNAHVILQATLGERGRSKIRDFMTPLFGPDPDPSFADIYAEYASAMPDAGSHERRREVALVFADRLTDIALADDPGKAIVALMGIARAQRVLAGSGHALAPVGEHRDLVDLEICHRIGQGYRNAYMVGAAIPLMDPASRRKLREDNLVRLGEIVRKNNFEIQLRKTFGGRSLDEIAIDPTFYRQIEDARNSGPIRRMGDFARRVVLFEAFASSKERKDFVSSLDEATIVPSSTSIEDAFGIVLSWSVAGGIPAFLSEACAWFLKWYVTYDPRSATEIAARFDAELRTDVLSAFVVANLACLSDPLAVPEAIVRMPDDEAARQQEAVDADEAFEEPIAPGPDAADEPAPDPRTEREIAAASEWESENARLSDLVSSMATALTDAESARPVLDMLEKHVRRLDDILREAEAARRPLDATAILSRLKAIATMVSEALSCDTATVPSAGTLDPRVAGRAEDGTTRGEVAGAAAARISAEANDIYGKLSGARLSERGRLASEYADLIDVVHSHGGRALEAVEGVISLISPSDLPATDATTMDEPGADADPEPVGDEQAEPHSPPDRIAAPAPPDRPRTAAEELVRDSIRRHGIRAGLVDARYRTEDDIGPFATVVLDAMLHPGRIDPSRYADADVRDTFELADIHLSDHPLAEHGEMAGLLAVAALEGATFAPSDVYSSILEHGEKGRLGRIAHALRQPILEVVSRIGLPTEETFASVSQILSPESPVEAARRVADAVRSSRFTYKAADRVRDRLCSREGFLGQAEVALSSGMGEDDILEKARRLASKKEASTHLDAIARELRVDRLFSSGRLKLQEAIVEVASTILAQERAAAASGPSDAHVVKLAVAADAAFLSARDIVRLEGDAFHRSLAKHALKILERYADLVNGRAPGRTAAKYRD